MHLCREKEEGKPAGADFILHGLSPRRQGELVLQGELGPPGCLGDTFETLAMWHISWHQRKHIVVRCT
jgi:hypothetical protein